MSPDALFSVLFAAPLAMLLFSAVIIGGAYLVRKFHLIDEVPEELHFEAPAPNYQKIGNKENADRIRQAQEGLLQQLQEAAQRYQEAVFCIQIAQEFDTKHALYKESKKDAELAEKHTDEIIASCKTMRSTLTKESDAEKISEQVEHIQKTLLKNSKIIQDAFARMKEREKELDQPSYARLIIMLIILAVFIGIIITNAMLTPDAGVTP